MLHCSRWGRRLRCCDALSTAAVPSSVSPQTLLPVQLPLNGRWKSFDRGNRWLEFSLRDLHSTAEVQQQPCLEALHGNGIYYPLPGRSPGVFLFFFSFLCSPVLVFQSRRCLESSHCSVSVTGLKTQGKEEFSSHHKQGRSGHSAPPLLFAKASAGLESKVLWPESF